MKRLTPAVSVVNETLRGLEERERAEVDCFNGELLRGVDFVGEMSPLPLAIEPLRVALGVAGDPVLALVDASSLVLAFLLEPETEATGLGRTGGRCTGVEVRELLPGSALAKFEMMDDW